MRRRKSPSVTPHCVLQPPHVALCPLWPGPLLLQGLRARGHRPEVTGQRSRARGHGPEVTGLGGYTMSRNIQRFDGRSQMFL